MLRRKHKVVTSRHRCANQRAMDCMGVGAVSEFAAGDPALAELRTRIEPVLYSSLVERPREGQAQGEIDPDFFQLAVSRLANYDGGGS